MKLLKKMTLLATAGVLATSTAMADDAAIDRLKGNWYEMKGKALEEWGELTGNDWNAVKGDAKKLSGKLQQKYGWTKEKAEESINKFANKFSSDRKRTNADYLKGNWRQLKGKIKKRWGRLTDDDIQATEGKIQELQGKVQKAYGKTKKDAQKEVDEWVEKLKGMEE